MGGKVRTIAVQLAAAAIALFGVVGLVLANLMRPSDSRTETAVELALLTIGTMTLAVVVAVAAGARFARKPWIAAAVMVTLAAGAAPHLVNSFVVGQSARQHQAELARQDAQAADAVAARAKDVEARISARRAYSPQESLAFVDAVALADLSYRGLPDRSEDMRALLKRALDAKILDPNIAVKGPRPVDVDAEPLFVHYHRAGIRPFPQNRIPLRDWKTLKLLVAGGADMTLPGAAAIAEDLRQPVTPDASGHFQLK